MGLYNNAYNNLKVDSFFSLLRKPDDGRGSTHTARRVYTQDTGTNQFSFLYPVVWCAKAEDIKDLVTVRPHVGRHQQRFSYLVKKKQKSWDFTERVTLIRRKQRTVCKLGMNDRHCRSDKELSYYLKIVVVVEYEEVRRCFLCYLLRKM